MKQELMDAIQETPVIAAVKDDDGLQNARRTEKKKMWHSRLKEQRAEAAA